MQDHLTAAMLTSASATFAQRAVTLEKDARAGTTVVTDKWGREVTVISPEAQITTRKAELWRELAEDLGGMP